MTAAMTAEDLTAGDPFSGVFGTGRGLSADQHAARQPAPVAADPLATARKLASKRTASADRELAELLETYDLADDDLVGLHAHLHARLAAATVSEQEQFIIAKARYLGMHAEEADRLPQAVYDLVRRSWPTAPSGRSKPGLYARMQEQTDRLRTHALKMLLADWVHANPRGRSPLHHRAIWGLRQAMVKQELEEPFYWLTRYQPGTGGRSVPGIRKRWVRRTLRKLDRGETEQLVAKLVDAPNDVEAMQALITSTAATILLGRRHT